MAGLCSFLFNFYVAVFRQMQVRSLFREITNEAFCFFFWKYEENKGEVSFTNGLFMYLHYSDTSSNFSIQFFNFYDKTQPKTHPS